MIYTTEIIEQISKDYTNGVPVEQIASSIDVPIRSIIAKLSSLGIYKKKTYINKNGETPVKKEIYLMRIADLLDVNLEMIESLEKCNKSVLVLLEKSLLNRS